MKLILQKDVKNLGKAGEPVAVKKGYARNYLIPQGLAIPSNKNRLKIWKHQKTIIEAKKRKALVERKALIQKLSSVRLKFEKESLKDGKLFGSVTAYEISQALEKLHNISVDKRDIFFTTLKTVGEHTVNIRLDSEHKIDLTVNIKGKITKKSKEAATTKEKSNQKTEEKTKSSEEPLKFKDETKTKNLNALDNDKSSIEVHELKSKDKKTTITTSSDLENKANSSDSPKIKSKEIKS